jgi:hypothetical protein
MNYTDLQINNASRIFRIICHQIIEAEMVIVGGIKKRSRVIYKNRINHGLGQLSVYKAKRFLRKTCVPFKKNLAHIRTSAYK